MCLGFKLAGNVKYTKVFTSHKSRQFKNTLIHQLVSKINESIFLP